MKIGCHCVLFGPAIGTDTDRILGDMAKTGCQGVELGARFFSIDKAAELKTALDKHGLVLAGLHTVVPLKQLLDDPAQCLASLERAAEALQGMPEKNILMTGIVDNKEDIAQEDSRLAQKDQVERLAANLDGIVETVLTKHGVQIHYHNHSWEFQNGGLVIKALLEGTRHLKICLDTGWAAVSGFDPVDLMEAHPEHFSYIHLRDYRKDVAARADSFAALQEQAYVDMGTGDMDYDRLSRCAQDILGDGGWAMIEYERGEVDYRRYVRAVSFLKGLVGERA